MLDGLKMMGIILGAVGILAGYIAVYAGILGFMAYVGYTVFKWFL